MIDRLILLITQWQERRFKRWPSRVCPVCERGTLSAERYSEQIQHNGKSLTVEDLERCRCDTCDADPVLTEQIRRNQVRICDAKRQADG